MPREPAPGKFHRPADLPGRVCRVLEGIDTDLMDAVELRKFADMVYRFAHIASGRCRNPHDDWVAEFERVELEVEESYYTSPKERRERLTLRGLAV